MASAELKKLRSEIAALVATFLSEVKARTGVEYTETEEKLAEFTGETDGE